jgi:hypothetical protein
MPRTEQSCADIYVDMESLEVMSYMNSKQNASGDFYRLYKRVSFDLNKQRHPSDPNQKRVSFDKYEYVYGYEKLHTKQDRNKSVRPKKPLAKRWFFF